MDWLGHNLINIVLLIMVGILIFLCIRSLKKPGQSKCCGSCSACGKTCHQIDFDEIRRNIKE